jgi:hypothetical protein
VRITRRPGALASGLLKVLDEAPSGTAPCAALAPNGSVVDRVKILIDESPSPTPLRRGSETATVAVVAVVSVLGALVLPTVLTGAEREREAVALVWSAAPPAPAADVPAGEPRAFDTYRRTALEVTPTTVRVYGRLAEHSQDNRRAALHACADLDTGCPVPRSTPSLGLRPAAITFDDAALERWEATPWATSSRPTVSGSSGWRTRPVRPVKWPSAAATLVGPIPSAIAAPTGPSEADVLVVLTVVHILLSLA